MKIMVAVDGSKSCDHALEMAKHYCREEDSIVVVSVGHWDSGLFGFLDEAAQNKQRAAVRSATEKLVADTVEKLRTDGVATVSGDAEIGNAREMILDAAEKHKIDLLIVGSRGLGMVKRMLLGSVSDYLMKHATCNVLIARAKENASE